MQRKIWTIEEDDLMREKFSDTQTVELCKMLNRNYSSVSGRAYVLGLKKSESFLKSDLSGRLTKLSEGGKVYRYAKGHIPANKGKKMSNEHFEKCKNTMFKKGHLPKNTKEKNGEITTRYDNKNRSGRQYKFIRISIGKWELFHRYVWEQKHGNIPKGYCLWFKDGNSLNCELENLELITRAENCSRNTIHQYPEELKSSIRLLTKVKKKINEKQSGRLEECTL